MGNDLFFVLVFPIALVSVLAAIWFWYPLTQTQQAPFKNHLRVYAPLAIGFFISMVCIALLTYFESAANFSSLVARGSYTDSQWAEYMPGRVATQAVLNLVFVLPAMSFAIVPMTVKLLKAQRLTLRTIGLRALIGWLALCVIGWVLFLHTVQVQALLVFSLSTLIPVVICALPIPVAALVFFRNRH